jgi:hypothetical protein
MEVENKKFNCGRKKRRGITTVAKTITYPIAGEEELFEFLKNLKKKHNL